jgi:hypothetical protein
MDGLVLHVSANHVLKVHPVELVAGENQDKIIRFFREIRNVAPHRVGGSLIPRLVLHRLLSGQNLNETAGKGIKLVGIVNMSVQAD